MSGFSRWTVDDMTIEPQIVNEVVIQLPDVSTIGLGDVVEQRCFQSETQALHEELLSYWTPTWQAMSTVEPSTWNWVIAFFQAHVPQLQLQLGPISPDQWFGALRKYRTNAARGVDGISPKDLLSLPMAWTLRLLDLLHAIELGQSVSTWWFEILDNALHALLIFCHQKPSPLMQVPSTECSKFNLKTVKTSKSNAGVATWNWSADYAGSVLPSRD